MSEKLKDKLKWYAVRTLSGKERETVENIEREASHNNLDKWIGEIVLPMEKVYKLRNGKKFSKDKLVMPGYIFLELKLIGEVERVIKKTKNVTGFIGDRNGKPEPLKQHEIDRIVGNMEKSIEAEATGEIPFIIGEKINVIDGPFSGFSGEVGNVDNDKQTLEVKVMIFSRETPLTLSYMQVDKI